MYFCSFVCLAAFAEGISLSPRQRFAEFISSHSRKYNGDEYVARLKLFEENLAKIENHNRRPGRMWKAGITVLADRSSDEVAALWGWNPRARPLGTSGGRPPATQLMAQDVVKEPLPQNFNWTHLKTTNNILDQGQCGSCWAVAATTVLRAHSEIYGDGRMFSAQQIVSCTPNPHKCGGSGGCDGATAELAFDYVLEKGLVAENEFPYTEAGVFPETPECPGDMKSQDRTVGDEKSHGIMMGRNNIGMVGWERLPENQLEPLMRALVERGPVAVSLAASDMWSFYQEGIMDDCVRDAVVNHAVTMIGYGESRDSKYWLIQNSWGEAWGEHGKMRILRRDDGEDTEDKFCGWDTQPEVGSGCEGGPSKVRVCGSCGILYDTVVPHFEGKGGLSKSGSLRSRHAQKHANAHHRREGTA